MNQVTVSVRHPTWAPTYSDNAPVISPGTSYRSYLGSLKFQLVVKQGRRLTDAKNHRRYETVSKVARKHAD